jgi:hypothetical protein
MSFRKSLKKNYRDLEFKLHRRKLSGRRFSNFDEQRIIEDCISQLNITGPQRTVVDIGASDGIRRSNSFKLIMDGWRGIGFEYDSRDAAKLAARYRFYPRAFACRCAVTPLNVVNLLKAYSIENDFGVLSLDIDGYDYWVLDALLEEFRPRLIVSEYNEKIPPPIKFTVKYDLEFRVTHHFYGYSIAKLEGLLDKHNYALINVEYNNVFLTPAELPGVRKLEIDEAYRTGYRDRADRKEKFRPNANMEPLLAMTPEKGIEFLNEFYAANKGKYEIGLD